MSRKLYTLAALSIALGLASYASADSVIFHDNFNHENGGVGVLNYTGFANWTVTNGSVDLIGNGFFDFLPGNGLYVDMDGTTNDAGTMVSKPLTLDAGSYHFQFDLAGSQRGPIEPVTASAISGVNTLASQVYSLPSDQGFTLYDLNFTLPTPATVNLSFAETGTSDEGELLDNVCLTECTAAAVPTPSAGWGALVLLGALGALKARKHMAMR